MAGFLNRLINSGAMGRLDVNDPLFGGLIPRREVMQDTMAQPVSRGMMGSQPQQQLIRQPSASVPIGRAAMPDMNKPKMNVVYDPTMEMTDLAKKKFEAEKDNTAFAQNLAAQKQGLDVQKSAFEQGQSEKKSNLEQSKFEEDKVGNKATREINERKQALDEWKSKNPEGEIKIAEDGKIMVVNKQTGKSIDTGLTSNDLSEKEKLDLQHKQDMAEITARGEQDRLTNVTRPRPPITASQQRVASDDAAAELLRDPNYSWLKDKEFITRDPDSKDIVIKRPTANDGSPDNVRVTTERLAAFEKAWKAKTDEILNKQFNSATNPASMENAPPAPAGWKYIRNADNTGWTAVEDKGSQQIVNPQTKPQEMPEVRDDVELFYDRDGKIIGARNRKNPRTAPFERE